MRNEVKFQIGRLKGWSYADNYDARGTLVKLFPTMMRLIGHDNAPTLTAVLPISSDDLLVLPLPSCLLLRLMRLEADLCRLYGLIGRGVVDGELRGELAMPPVARLQLWCLGADTSVEGIVSL